MALAPVRPPRGPACFLTRHKTSPPISPTIPPSSSTPTVTRGDFVALYERCVASGLKARVTICYTAGQHEVCITCLLSPSPSATVGLTARRCCHRRRSHRDWDATRAVHDNRPSKATADTACDPLQVNLAPSPSREPPSSVNPTAPSTSHAPAPPAPLTLTSPTP